MKKIKFSKVISVLISCVLLLQIVVPTAFAKVAVSENTIIKNNFLKKLGSVEKTSLGKIELYGNFAYIKNATGIEVWNISTPTSPTSKQDAAIGQIAGFVVGNGYLYARILEGSTYFLKTYQIDNDGNINTAALSSISLGTYGSDGISEINLIDDKYIFVTCKASDNATRIFDVSNGLPEYVMSITSVVNSGTGVSTKGFDVIKNADGTYRMFSYNRCYYNDAHRYDLRITDIDMSAKTYTDKYFGAPTNSSFVQTEHVVNYITALDSKSILVTFAGGRSAEIFDVTDPTAPKFVATTNSNSYGMGYAINPVKVDDKHFIIAGQGGNMNAFAYYGGAVVSTTESGDNLYVDRASDKIQVIETGKLVSMNVYRGFLYVVSESGITIWRLLPDIKITSEAELSPSKPVVTGIVDADYGSIVIEVNGNKEVVEDVNGSEFSYELENFAVNTDIAIKVSQLDENDNVLAEDSATVKVVLNNEAPTLNTSTLYNALEQGKVSTYATDAAITNVAFTNIGDKAFAYVQKSTGAVDAVDVTNPANPTKIQTYDTLLNGVKYAFDNKLVIQKSSNIIASYGLNVDGTVNESAYEENTFSAIQEVEKAGKYLFVTIKSTSTEYDLLVIDPTQSLKEIAHLDAAYTQGVTTAYAIKMAAIETERGIYKIALQDREWRTEGEKYELLLAEFNSETNVFTPKYIGVPTGAANVGSSCVSLDFIDADTLIWTGNQNDKNGDIIDVSNMANPAFLRNVERGHLSGGAKIAPLGIGNGLFVAYGSGGKAGVMDSATGIRYANLQYSCGTPTATINRFLKHNGFLYSCTANGLYINELIKGIDIATNEADCNNSIIEGNVLGAYADSTITVEVDGKTYNATIQGDKYQVNIGTMPENTVEFVNVTFTTGKYVKGTYTANAVTKNYGKYVSFKNAKPVISDIKVEQNGAEIELNEVQDGKATVKVNLIHGINEPEGSKVYIALYKDELTLVAAASRALTDIEVYEAEFDVIQTDASTYTVKAFVWSKGLESLCDSYSEGPVNF